MQKNCIFCVHLRHGVLQHPRPMSNPIARINGEFPAVSRLALSAIAAAAVTTQAVEFENDVVEGSLDTTLSYGASFRTSAAEPGNIGIAHVRSWSGIVDHSMLYTGLPRQPPGVQVSLLRRHEPLQPTAHAVVASLRRVGAVDC